MPVGLGPLHDATGSWTVPLAALLVAHIPLGAAGFGTSRDRYIGTELRRSDLAGRSA